jgi:chromosome segregation ATPase
MPDDDKKPADDKKADDKPKDDLGDAGKKALDAERKARRDAEAALRDAKQEVEKLKADSDTTKSEMDKVLTKLDGLEKRAADAERKALVAEVSQAKKLPAAIAGRLTGSTKDELEADADELIEALGLGKDDKPKDDDGVKPGPGGRPKEKLRSGASNDGDETPDYEKIAEGILSKNKY